MKLKKLTLQNIRSYENAEISFPDGSTLLSGDIGSGKTSILLSMEYALFGLQPGQRGSSLLANGKDSAKVILEMEIGGKDIVIERGLKRGSKTISQDFASIIIDGEKTESSVTEIKTKILELMNYPQEFLKKNNLLYRYTVYTPQEQMKQIMLEDSESRLNILRHIFGIDKYKRIKENLSVLTLKLREESRILQVEIRDLDENRNKLDSDKKFINLLNEKIGIKEKSLAGVLKEKEEAEKSMKGIEEKIREKDNFMKEIEKTNILLISKRDQLTKEEKAISELEGKVSQHKELFEEESLKKVLSLIRDKKIQIDGLNGIHIDISSRIESLRLRSREDLEKKNRIFKIDICPTCLQDVPESHRHNILNETEAQLKRSEKEESELSVKLDEAIKNLEREKSNLSELETTKSGLEILKIRTEEVNSAQEKLTDLKKSKETLVKDIGFLENHITSLKESTLEFAKFDNFLKLAQDSLREILQREKHAEIELAEIKKEIEITKREINELEKKVEQTEKTRQKLIKTLETEKWLSNDFLNLIDFTERNIMLTLRNEFSKIFNQWFSMLTTDSFYVTLDENFAPIITQGDFELDYAYLSGGERTAVALAYRLALNQILNSLLSEIKTQGLVILDEPTDGFSDQQLDKVRDILQELKAEQLILVSHEPKIEGFVDNVIKLKKEGGISKISN